MPKTSLSKWDNFNRKTIATALKAWRDLPSLGQHPLANLDIVEHLHEVAGYRDGTGGYGLALRRVLRETIELLRPEHGEPNFDDRRWFPYLILLEQDVNGRSRTALMGLFGTAGLPERTYDHYRAEALDRLVNLLREKELEISSQPIGPYTTLRFDHVDWGDAPDTRAFHGRQIELAEIERGVVDDCCRVIGIVGLGGVGKTALAAHATRWLADRFERVIWRSLRNAPPLDDLLIDYLRHLSERPDDLWPSSLEERLALTLHWLRERRCLLILDNLETILRAGTPTGDYRPGYADYGDFLRQVAEASHQSCLIVTSREMPPEIAAHANGHAIRALSLGGLAPDECRALLADKQLIGGDDIWPHLAELYSGNPLALQIVTETIRDLFGGDIARFLAEGAPVFGEMRGLLDQQFDRLSPLESDVLYWLAIEREPASSDRLRHNLIVPPSWRELLEALDALRRRSLIEFADNGFTLPNLIMEHVTDRMVDRINHEITTGSIGLLNTHALLQARAKDYVRQTQIRLIVQPVIERLLAHSSDHNNVREHLLSLIATQRDQTSRAVGYTAGNLLNLWCQAGISLRGVDLSGLVIREGYLVEADLAEADFSRADLSGSVFAETLTSVHALAFSHSGQVLAAGVGSNDIHVWRLADGQRMLTLHGHTNLTRSLSFSADDRFLASASSDQTIRVWDTHTGECIQTIVGHTHRVRCVQFSADGRRLFSSSTDRTVREWEASTGELLRTLNTDATVFSFALSPDEQTLVAGGVDHIVGVWDLATNSLRTILRDHTGPIRSVAYSSDGQWFASGGEDNTVRLWDAHALECVRTLTGHTKWVFAVAFSVDGAQLASSSDDSTVRVWDVVAGQCRLVLRGHTNSIEALVFAPDGRTLASGSSDQSILMWDAISGQRLRKLGGAGNTQWALAFSRDSRWLFSGGTDGMVYQWDVESGQQTTFGRAHPNWVQGLALSPDGDLLTTCGTDFTLKVWDVSTRQCVAMYRGHTAYPTWLAFSPDGRYLASASEDSTVRVWDTATNQCVQVLTEFTNSVRWVVFSPVGDRLAACGDDGQAIVWGTATWQSSIVLYGHATVWQVAFSPDGEILATSDEAGFIEIWDAQTGQSRRTLPQNPGRVWTLDFHPNGDWLVANSGDETVRVWDIHTGEQVMQLIGHTAQLRYALYSPDGRFIVTSADDQTLRIWQADTGECVHVLHVGQLYEGLKIAGARGLSEAQRASLKALGAIDTG